MGLGCTAPRVEAPCVIRRLFRRRAKRTSSHSLAELSGRAGKKVRTYGSSAKCRSAPTRCNCAPSSTRSRPNQVPGKCVRPICAAESAPQHRCGHRSEETPEKSPGAPPMQVSQEKPLDIAHANILEIRTCYRPRSPTHTPRTTPSGADARERYYRTCSEFRPCPSHCGNRRAPSNRPAKNTSDWRSDWRRGRPKE